MTGTVFVIGSINVDKVTQAEHLPRPGETIVGTDFTPHAGGKGANQAVAAARLGARVRLIGAIGTDADGDYAASRLAADSVDASLVARLPDAPTGIAVIVVDASSENLIIVSSGANRRIPESSIHRMLEEAADGDVLTIALEGGTAPARTALARRPAARTILNLSPVTHDALDLIGQADVVILNEHECATLLANHEEVTPERATAGLARLGARTVIVTRGAEGAWLLEGLDTDTPRHSTHSAPRVAAVDTTGCGDAFAGALAAGLAHGTPLSAAVDDALRVASFAATRHGAQDSYPYPQDLASL